MKSRKATALVEITYWTCAQPNHRHRTKAVATACIEKRQKPVQPRTNNHWTKAKMIDVCEAVIRGATYREVGAPLNIQPARVQQVVNKALRLMSHPSLLDEPMPEGARRSIDDARKHSDFWIRRIEKFRANET